MSVRYAICYLGCILMMGVYCVGKVHKFYLSSIRIFGAYCVDKVHNMLPQKYDDNGGILCR